MNYSDPTGSDPVPSWATRIINGTATEIDYQKALSVNPDSWAGSAGRKVNQAIRIAEDHVNQMVGASQKNNFTPRKDKRKDSENRQKSGSRERNIGHPEGEEHSRVAKGNQIHRSVVIDTADVLTGVAIVIVGTVALTALLADDSTGVGIADDTLMIPVVAFIEQGVERCVG